MNHFAVFFKKELKESVKTYKLLLLGIVFLILGIMNPLVAKLTPDLLASFLPEGMSITIPEPSSLDSWAQFFKNIQQMGLIVVLLVFSGVLTNELSRGTLVLLLTKGLPRQTVILAKYAAMLVLWTMSVAISHVVTWVYTVYLFPDNLSQNLFFATFCLWFFGALLLAVLLLGGTLVSSSYGSLLVTGGLVVLLNLLNLFSALKECNPLALATKNMDVVSGAVAVSELYPQIGITVALILVTLGLTVLLFRRKLV